MFIHLPLLQQSAYNYIISFPCFNVRSKDVIPEITEKREILDKFLRLWDTLSPEEKETIRNVLEKR